MRIFNDRSLLLFRRKLRRKMTFAETVFWNFVRHRQCAEVKFRRQVSIGRYVADFYSFERKLVIEIDGHSHFTLPGRRHDAIRNRFFQKLGITILRFDNEEVISNLDGCGEVLELFLTTEEMVPGARFFLPPPAPPDRGRDRS